MDYRELEAYFRSLDRSFFLENDMKEYAAYDSPLPIGFGQTISQPSLVLEMTKLLAPEHDSKVIEIGTGSGFQTALLAKMSGKVFTVERIAKLSQKAKERLNSMNFTNIFYKVGDGSLGWVEHAPYDRIMVTAAARVVPDELMGQLAPGGRMVIPIGPPDVQELQVITKRADGRLQVESAGMVRFVELKGRYGWGE
ncbi:MAG: protein-L-isoaspartate(D-aspartate) O-methyltransferase [Eubacteriales bacterium]